MKHLRRIRQRQIYWLIRCEPLDGEDEKDRPVIVLSTRKQIESQDILLVVACTTTPRSTDPLTFEVPDRKRDAQTGLSETCWALPRWYLNINRNRLTELKGDCPIDLFNDLFEAVLTQMEADSGR